MYYNYDSMNVILIFIAISSVLITVLAQAFISISYRKYKNIDNSKNITGYEVAREILDKSGLKDINIVETRGSLTDHYDPTRKVIRLSSDIYHGSTIASTSVAAHEVGHAIQDKEGYKFMRIRASLVPIVNLCSKFGYIVLMIGWIFSMLDLAYVGIILLGATLLFQLITLPVEFDASRRAGVQIKKLNILNSMEQDGSKRMLMAAAFTYVASLITTVLEILRLFILTRSRDDR